MDPRQAIEAMRLPLSHLLLIGVVADCFRRLILERSVRLIRRNMYAVDVGELARLFASSDPDCRNGVQFGTLYKNRKILVVLCQNEPVLRPNGRSESFPVTVAAFRATGDLYMSVYVGTNTRLSRILGDTFSGNRVLVHRLITYLAGKTVPPGYHVHHVNHNPHDNRRENLVIVEPCIHLEYHGSRVLSKIALKNPQTINSIVNEMEMDSKFHLHVIYYDQGYKGGENWRERMSNTSASIIAKMARIIDAVRNVGRIRSSIVRYFEPANSSKSA